MEAHGVSRGEKCAVTKSPVRGDRISGQRELPSAASRLRLLIPQPTADAVGKERVGAIKAEQRQRAWAAFRHHVEEETIGLVPVSEATLKKANHILEQCHPSVALRSLDALHLAACDQTQDWPLCTTDARMRQASEVLRFTLAALPS